MNRSVNWSTTNRVQPVLARAIVCSVLLALSSCAIPNLRLGQPACPVPTTFNGVATPNNSAQLDIKAFFNDPVLTHLIEEAVANNRELKSLNEEVRVAASFVLKGRGAYLPFVGFRGKSELERYSRYTLPGAGVHTDPYMPGRFLPNPLPDHLLSLPFFWQVDIWRELRNGRDAAILRFQAAVEKRNYYVTRLVADVADNYFTLMALDKRYENLNLIIELQQKSLKIAEARYELARSTELPVRRFEAEVRKNESGIALVKQDIIETENRINYLLNRYPQPVVRDSAHFFELNFPLAAGVPAQLLQNRPDIREAERDLEANGLDIKVARAKFFPKLDLSGTAGFESFNPQYLFWGPSTVFNIASEVMAPLINKKAIQAEYIGANAKQLESLYDYQRIVLNAFTEVVNRMAKVENYGTSVTLKKQQVQALEAAVAVATNLFQNARIEYIDVLFAQRDLWDARFEWIQTRQQQLSAFVYTYQALGGGVIIPPYAAPGADPGVPTGHKFFHRLAPPNIQDTCPPTGAPPAAGKIAAPVLPPAVPAAPSQPAS
jgi:outer membrane protein, multidrug efflux system